MCIDWVSKVRLDKIARYLSVWGQKNPAGIKLQYFCQYGDRKKPNQRTKLSIYILDTIESESTTRFKNRSSDRMMTSDWLVDVSDDRYTTIKRSLFSCPVTDNFIWIEPILRGHLSYKATFSLSQGWHLNTDLTTCFVDIRIHYNALMMRYNFSRYSDISKIQDNLSDIRSGNLEKLSDRKKIFLTEKKPN